jgi:hypothetical protein
MTSIALSQGNVPANSAGMIAKYFAASFAIENVVNEPRVIRSCLPISTTSTSFVGLLSRSTARRCRTDQPTLSKVLRGRMESVTIDRLTVWLIALGRTVEIRIRPYDAKAKTGHLVTTP